MTEQELVKEKIDTFVRVIQFTKSALEKELENLNNMIAELESQINQALALGAKVSNAAKNQLEKLKSMKAKVLRDLAYINNLLAELVTIQTTALSTDEQEKLNHLENMVKDLEKSKTATEADDKVQELNDEISTLDPTIPAEQEKINKLVERINRINAYRVVNKKEREKEIERLKKEINKIADKKLKASIAKLSPFFKRYDSDPDKTKLLNGKSMFENIIESTDTYAKMSSEINALEGKMNALAAKRIAKGKELNPKGDPNREQRLAMRIDTLKRKSVAISAEQKIVAIHRQKAIDKRNNRVAALEGKIKNQEASNKNIRATINKKRLAVLKKIPITLKPARMILFTEHMKADWNKTSTLSDGSLDARSWQQFSLDRLQGLENEQERHKKRL